MNKTMKSKKPQEFKKTKTVTKSPEQKSLKIDQKLTLLAIGVVLVFLTGLVYFKKTTFQYQNNEEKNNTQLSQDQEDQYQKLLASIKPDPEASKQLFKKIISEEDVRAQMEQDLQTKRTITQPVVPDRDIRFTDKTGKDSLVEYFRNLAPLVDSLNKSVFPISSNGFQGTASVSDLSSGIANSQVYIESLKQLPVPREAAGFHKSELLTAYTNKVLLEEALSFTSGKNNSPWSEVYKQHVIADKQISIADTELDKLDKKYQIRSIAIVPGESKFAGVKEFFQIKEAHALTGVGDTVIIVGNIPEQVEKGIKSALASAYGKYATKFLDTLIGKIDENFRIANYIYYGDEVKIDYVNKYLAKYSNQVDQEIVKRFIPELNCGKNQNASLKPIFQAKAEEYLGFNPALVDSNDPDFELKMARVGEYLANPTGAGWQAQYEEQAQIASSEAEKAVTRELLGKGIKSPRDLVDNQIAASLNVIEGSQIAALIASMQLGSANTENIVSQMVTSVLDSLAQKFVFKGAVFLERETCTPIPVLKPVIAGEPTIYKSPDLNPNPTLRGTP